MNAVQLHSKWQPALIGRLNRIFDGQLGIIQTVHWAVNEGESSGAAVLQQLREIEQEGIADRILIDSKVGQATGGTGVTFDWAAARNVLSGGRLKIIVAGGLRQENVAEAIRELNPWGVDVASGVERGPGRKDTARMAAFIETARAAAEKA